MGSDMGCGPGPDAGIGRSGGRSGDGEWADSGDKHREPGGCAEYRHGQGSLVTADKLPDFRGERQSPRTALADGYVLRRQLVVGDRKGTLRVAVQDRGNGFSGSVRVPLPPQ